MRLARTFRKTVVTVILFGVVQSAYVTAQIESLEEVLQSCPGSVTTEREKVMRALKAYRSREETLLEKTAQDLHRLANITKADKSLSAAQRANYLMQLERVQRWLAEGIPPGECDVALPIITTASTEVFRLGMPVRRAATILAKKLARTDEGLARKFTEAVENLGGVMNARTTIVPGRRYDGKRFAEGSAEGTSLRFILGNAEGDRVFGKVEHNMHFIGHPHHRIDWTIEGLTLYARTAEKLRTENRTDIAAEYQGVVLGNLIIGTYSGRDAAGKPVRGTFRVEAK